MNGTAVNWANAGSTAGDVVLEQTDTKYDKDGEPTLTTTKQRDDNDPTTGGDSEGDLTGPTSDTTASRDSYEGEWYDNAGRETADADYGTNGSVAITAAPAVPPGAIR